jgi:hypothetical protein
MSNGNVVISTFAVNTALKNSGAGVEVYGFNYGYNYSLGDARRTNECVSWAQAGVCGAYLTDNPTAQVRVRLTDNNNDVIYSAIQSRSTPNTAENVSYQFLLPSTTNSMALGNFSLGASTSGNAAIQNMYANALYKPDPCVDPLYSPSCPGYGAAFAAKLNSNNNVTSTAKTASAVVVTTESAATSGAPVVNVGGVQMSGTGTISAPDNIPQALKDIQAVVQQSQTSAPQASNTQQQQQQQSNKSAPNMSLIMSIVGQIQAADRATQAAAVQNANQVAAASSAKAQEQANQVVESLNTMSAASSQSSQLFAANTTAVSFTAAMPQQLTIAMAQPAAPVTTSLQTLMLASTQSATAGQAPVAQSTPVTYSAITSQAIEFVQTYQDLGTVNSPFSMASAYVASRTSNTISTASMPMAEPVSTPVFAGVLAAKSDASLSDNSVPVPAGLAARTTSVTEMAEVRANVEAAQNEQQTETVKKNVQANELAGGVDIASIATQPQGFDVYSTTVIKDGAFYAPKDIYGNQKTIDNARALRSLSSDRLHQDMVDQQYKGK